MRAAVKSTTIKIWLFARALHEDERVGGASARALARAIFLSALFASTKLRRSLENATLLQKYFSRFLNVDFAFFGRLAAFANTRRSRESNIEMRAAIRTCAVYIRLFAAMLAVSFCCFCLRGARCLQRFFACRRWRSRHEARRSTRSSSRFASHTTRPQPARLAAASSCASNSLNSIGEAASLAFLASAR